MNHHHYSDEELAIKAQNDGHSSAAESDLVLRYWDLTAIIANEKVVRGIDHEDRQASCIQALLKAIRRFEAGRGANFKTFAKNLMRNELVELHRKATRVKEVPRSLIRSLDELVGYDDDGASLLDLIAGESEATVMAGLMAEVLASETQSAQWDKFSAAILGMDGEFRSRIINSVMAIAALVLADDEFADIRDLVAEATSQLVLLPMAPARDSERAKGLAERVFKVYAEVLVNVITDRVSGYDLGEIAERVSLQVDLDITRPIVSMILGSAKENERALAA